MPSPSVVEFIRARLGNLKGCADTLSVVTHSALRGRFREILAQDLIVPYLPPQIEVLSGVIVGVDEEHHIPTLLLEELRNIGYEPKSGQTPCPIQGVCILGRGSWFLTKLNEESGWYTVDAVDDRELLSFVSIVSNYAFGNGRGLGTHVLDTSWLQGPSPASPLLVP